MRIKHHLANKLKDLGQPTPEKPVSGRNVSFNEAVSRASRLVTEKIDKDGSGNARGNNGFAHHAVHSDKKITLDQANRLKKISPYIVDSCKRHRVPVELVCAVILQESGGNPRAVSHAGAKGLMQLMPGTARRFGVTNSFNPQQNIEGGTKYLKFLLDRFNGDYRLALAGYNAGEGNVQKYGNKIPPFAETRNYVPSVLAYADTIHKILNATPEPTASAAIPSHFKRV